MAASAIPERALTKRKIILVTASKGGVGKTTTVANLAVAGAQHGLNVCAIDFDPQASLSHWGEARPEGVAAVNVLQASLNEYQNALAFTQRYDLVVIDTPPGVSSQTTEIQGLANRSDVILIPTSMEYLVLQQLLPYGMDLMAALKGRRPIFILNKYERLLHDTQVTEVRKHMENCGKVCLTPVRKLVDIERPFREGQTVLDGYNKLSALDVRTLWDYVREEISIG